MICFTKLISRIIQAEPLHAKWLNTLSYLENCGARKIAACEHPTLVKKEMLKHAAEEFRHALHLKRQIDKVTATPYPTYTRSSILGSLTSWHYLNALDLQTSRFLKFQSVLPKSSLKETSYLLVTYAIEMRAAELYPLYDKILREKGSQVTVKCILLEEKEHLAEMRTALLKLPQGFVYAEQVLTFEKELFAKWLTAIHQEVSSSSY